MGAAYTRKYNAAATLDGVMLRTAGTGTILANPTLASGDVKISKDAGAYANLATLPSAIPASGKNIQVALSSTESTCARATIIFSDQTVPPQWDDFEIVVETFGHASATFPQDYSLPNQAANVTQWNGTNVATPETAGYPKVTFAAAERQGIARTVHGHKNVYFVSKAGSDANAGTSPAEAKLTLTATQTAAVAGDIIIVLDGTYAESGLGKDQADWHFTNGSKIEVTTEPIADRFIFGSTTAKTFSVTGRGEFINTNTEEMAFEIYGIHNTHADSVINIECKRVFASQVGINSEGIAVNTAGRVKVVADKIEASGDACKCLGGYQHIEASLVDCESHAIATSTGGTAGYQYARVTRIDGGDGVIYSGLGTQVVECESITAFSSAVRCDGGNQLIRAGNITTTDASGIGTTAVYFVGGKSIIEASYINGLATESVVRVYAGASVGELTIRGARLDASAAAGVGVLFDAGTSNRLIRLENVSIRTGASATESISASEAQTVRVAGTVHFDRAVNANVTISHENAFGTLHPTVDGRSLDVSATGEAGIDWANVGSPTTTLVLSGTTVGITSVLTNLPTAPTDWLTAAAVKADAVTKIQAGLSTLTAAQVNAEADAALLDVGMTTTITGRIDAATSTRMATYTQPTGFLAGDFTRLDVAVSTRSTVTTAQVNTEADTALTDYGALKPTTAGRTLDVSATGEAGLDWANVGSPTATLGLTNTTVGIVTTLTEEISGGLDAAGMRAAIGMATADMDAHLNSLATTAYVAVGFASIEGGMLTMADSLIAIQAKTDQLTSFDFVTSGTRFLTMIVADGGVHQYTANAVELAPTGGGGGLDAAGVRSAIGMASANLDTQLTTIDDFLDTEIAAIKAKTDGLTFNGSNLNSNIVEVDGEEASATGPVDFDDIAGGAGGTTNLTITGIQANSSNPRYSTRTMANLAQGSAPTDIWVFTDANEDPIDLSGKTIRLVFATVTDEGDEEFDVFDDTLSGSFQYETEGDGLTVGGASNNQVTLVHDDEKLATAGQRRFFWWNVTDKLLLAKGGVTIEPTVFEVV